MAIVKSKLLKQLSDNYPNFLKKDLEKSLNIVLSEIKLALYKGENVEFRDFGTWSINIQKARKHIEFNINLHCFHSGFLIF